MKSLKCILLSSIAAGAALLFGCATTQSTQNRENMLVACGFKVITPKTAAQQQKLHSLPPGKVTMIQKAGKTYYIFQTRRITRLTSVDPSSTALPGAARLKQTCHREPRKRRDVPGFGDGVESVGRLGRRFRRVGTNGRAGTLLTINRCNASTIQRGDSHWPKVL